MIKAKHQPLWVWFFKYYIHFIIQKHFHEVAIKGDTGSAGSSILLIGNHFSWWDGFFAAYLNHQFYHKDIHVMMLEDQLQQHHILNKIGAFGIKQQSRDIAAGISYSQTVLKHPNNMLVMFPQGKFASLYHYPVTFQRGIIKILEETHPYCQIIFMAALIDYFSHKKPTLTLSLKPYSPASVPTLQQIEDAYNQHLQESIHEQKAPE